MYTIFYKQLNWIEQFQLCKQEFKYQQKSKFNQLKQFLCSFPAFLPLQICSVFPIFVTRSHEYGESNTFFNQHSNNQLCIFQKIESNRNEKLVRLLCHKRRGIRKFECGVFRPGVGYYH